jgi:membrane protease YdiL (CAAX protease family)
LDRTDNTDNSGPQITERPLAVAPLWHTWLVLLVISIPLLAHEFGPWRGFLHLFAFIARDRESLYLVAILVQSGIFAFVYWGLHIQHTPLSVLIGRTWNDSWDKIRDLGLGLGALFLVLCSTALLVYLFGPLDRDKVDIYPKTAVQFYFFFLLAVSGGFFEEIIFRGYLLKQMTYLFNNGTAALLLQAAFFSLAHGVHEGIAGVCNKFFIGLLFGYISFRRKSLMPAIVAHCGLDAAAAILSVLH